MFFSEQNLIPAAEFNDKTENNFYYFLFNNIIDFLFIYLQIKQIIDKIEKEEIKLKKKIYKISK